MSSSKEPVTIDAGCAIGNDYIYLAGKPDRLEQEQEFSRLFFYDAQNKARPWAHHDLDEIQVVSLCVVTGLGANAREYCALGRHGEVEFTWVGGSRIERIAGAGLRRDTPPIYGYVQAIRQVGRELFVVGSGGQVYRRDGGAWSVAAPALLKPVVVPDSVSAAAGLDIGGKEFAAIDGVSAEDLYVVGGNGEIFHYDGAEWTECESPARRPLTAVRAVSAQEIWVCGNGGVLLRGNARSGFAVAGSCSAVVNFSGLGLLGGQVYLAANKGLFLLGEDGIVRHLKTGLEPEVDDSHTLDVKDGVLWSFGYKDVVSFDGTRWQRLVHPDNAD